MALVFVFQVLIAFLSLLTYPLKGNLTLTCISPKLAPLRCRCVAGTTLNSWKDIFMSIEQWSENIVLVNLAKEPELGEDLQATVSLVTENPDCYVAIDFSDVQILTSSSIAKMLKLRKIVRDNGRNLVLSSVSRRTKEIFVITGIDSVFEFVEDKTFALASLQLAVQPA